MFEGIDEKRKWEIRSGVCKKKSMKDLGISGEEEEKFYDMTKTWWEFCCIMSERDDITFEDADD